MQKKMESFQNIYHICMNPMLQCKNILWRIKNRKLYEIVKENKKFHNIHKGERCFIVGNGPSLNMQDLSLLADEYVFTVNQIARKDDFSLMKTNYHFWSDSNFFELDTDKEEDLNVLKAFLAIKTDDNNPICFLPTYAYDFAKKFGLPKQLNIAFYHLGLYCIGKHSKDINFSKSAYFFSTVVQIAISMAIYMGFSEIYLLGCDTTGILTAINNCLNEENENNTHYAYHEDNYEKSRMKRISYKTNIKDHFFSMIKILQGYQQLNEYCEVRKIKLANCSAKTIVDSLVRMKYEDVIKH